LQIPEDLGRMAIKFNFPSGMNRVLLVCPLPIEKHQKLNFAANLFGQADTQKAELSSSFFFIQDSVVGIVPLTSFKIRLK
jgi:hypothetical protein